MRSINFIPLIDRLSIRGDGAARAATFTPDGRFLSSVSKHDPKGESAADIGARTTKGVPSSTRHIMLNIQITPTAEGADGKAYALIISSQLTPGTITGQAGFYYDKLVRPAQGWRFKQREVWLDSEKALPTEARSYMGAIAVFEDLLKHT